MDQTSAPNTPEVLAPVHFYCTHCGALNTDAPERFWAKVEMLPEEEGGCWIWRGAKHHSGYGYFIPSGQPGDPSVKAHKYAREQIVGPVPDGYLVCHNCPRGDRKDCVRPSHTFLGTSAVNSWDSAAKGHYTGGRKRAKDRAAFPRVPLPRGYGPTGKYNAGRPPTPEETAHERAHAEGIREEWFG